MAKTCPWRISGYDENNRRCSVGLERCEISVRVISNFCCEVTTTQKFTNEQERGEGKILNSCYSFPLDGSAAVCSFTATLSSGHVIRGRVKEKQKAQHIYEEAVSKGAKAALMVQESTTKFQCDIGNLDAGESCEIEIKYITELTLCGDKIELVLPSIGHSQKSIPTAVTIRAQMTSPIKSIESPSHDGLLIAELGERDPCNVVVKLKDDWLSKSQTKDVTIHFGLENPFEIRSQLEVYDKYRSEALLLTFCQKPILETQATDLPCELIFLVDVSGSMAGEPIECVRKMLQLFLRSLPTKCKFNIVTFDTNYKKMFETSQIYNQETLTEASEFVKNLRDGGGTRLYAPLKILLEDAPSEGYPKQIFLLTDGQVPRNQDIFELVSRHSKGCRIFTFGIGNAVDRRLCSGVARAGQGEVEFVEDRQISKIVVRSLVRALQPALCDVKIDWNAFSNEGRNFFQFPTSQPQMYPNQRYFIYGIREMLQNSNEEQIAEGPSSKHQRKQQEQQQHEEEGVQQREQHEQQQLQKREDEVPEKLGGEQARVVGEVEGEGGHTEMKSSEYFVEVCGHFSDQRVLKFDIPVDPVSSYQGCLIHALAARSQIAELELLPETPEIRKEVVELSEKYNISSKYASFVAIEESLDMKDLEDDLSSQDELEKVIEALEDLAKTETINIKRMHFEMQAAPSGERQTRKQQIEACQEKLDEMKQGLLREKAKRKGSRYAAVPPVEITSSMHYVGNRTAQMASIKVGIPVDMMKSNICLLEHQSTSLYSYFTARMFGITKRKSAWESSSAFESIGSGIATAAGSLFGAISSAVTSLIGGGDGDGNEDMSLPTAGGSYSSAPLVEEKKEAEPAETDVTIVKSRDIREMAFEDFIMLQRFDGSWDIFPEISAMVSKVRDSFKADEALQGVELSDQFLSSVICLVILKAKFNERASEWVMVQAKLQKYLENGLQNMKLHRDLDALVVRVERLMEL